MLSKQISLAAAFMVVNAVGLINSLPARGQTRFQQADYKVQHDFRIGFGNSTPIFNFLGAQISGNASCANPWRQDPYSEGAILFGTTSPLEINLNDSGTVGCRGASASSMALAQGQINGNVLSGTTLVTGQASAFSPPGGWGFAQSSAALFASQLGINPNGQIAWQPLFFSRVSGAANARARRIVDPILFNITDPNTEEMLLSGTFLDIVAEHDGVGSSIEWGADGASSEDDRLDINFVNNGFFKIEIPDDAPVINPGLFDLACETGEITHFERSGRFSSLTGLPTVGDNCNFSIPFSENFSEEIVLNYDFTGLLSATDVNLLINASTNGFGDVDIPEPTSTLGLLALSILGTSSGLLRKKQQDKSASRITDDVE